MRSPYTTFHCSPTKSARGTCCSHRDLVMLFCPPFTQSERFLQTDQVITRLRRVEHTATCCRVIANFMRMSTGHVFMYVMESDAVLVGSDLPALPRRCSTNCCICQSPKALRCAAGCHDLRVAFCNLLTVAMHL